MLRMLSKEIQLNATQLERNQSARSTIRRGTSCASGLELVACGGVFDTNGIGGKNGEARRFLGWNTERHWVLGPHRENDAPAQQ